MKLIKTAGSLGLTAFTIQTSLTSDENLFFSNRAGCCRCRGALARFLYRNLTGRSLIFFTFKEFYSGCSFEIERKELVNVCDVV